MLVITRKIDEKVTIGDCIVIQVVRIDRNSVRLGITAPRDIKILRKELLKRDVRRSEVKCTDDRED